MKIQEGGPNRAGVKASAFFIAFPSSVPAVRLPPKNYCSDGVFGFSSLDNHYGCRMTVPLDERQKGAVLCWG